MSQKVRVSTKN